MDNPKYSYPLGLLTRVSCDVILLHRRSFRKDAKACIANLRPPLQVWGQENIPQTGHCVLTINHYHRPGFGVPWLVLAVSALVPLDVHWVITGEFADWGKWFGPLGTMSSRMLSKRIAHIYGSTNMPPMPPRPQDLEARAAAVRAVLEYVRQTKDPILGLAPEGYDAPQGVLTRPASGLGRFGLLLSKAGMNFIPVGVYEEDRRFQVHFGECYRLRPEAGFSVDPGEKDKNAMQIIMKNIARLLPSRLRGEFI